MDNQNFEDISLGEEKKITIKPETDIISGKMRFNLSNITGKKEKLIFDLGELKEPIIVDVEYFDGDLSGHFEIEEKDTGENNITFINQEGGIIFKETVKIAGNKAIDIKLTGKPNENLRIDIDKEQLPPDIDINKEDLDSE